MFLDGDKTNFNIDNLKAVDRVVQITASTRNLLTEDKEINEKLKVIAFLDVKKRLLEINPLDEITQQ